MDIAIQMRSIELMLKFLKHDLKNVPSYGYALQKRALPEAQSPKPLPRSTPEAEGIRSEAVRQFYEAVSKEADSIAAHAVLVMRHGKIIAEGAWAPYRLDVPHMLYSMSKSVTGTAIGIAVDEGLLSLDERLTDIFSDLVSPTQAKVIRNMTVRHLLTMSTGCRFNEIGSMLDENWAKMFLESLPKFEPGTAFEYNSLNTYMLAAILARRTGQTLVEYLRPRLFAPLGIERFQWETCPQGVEKGGWGLSLTLEDAAKLGQLYLNRGMWEGKRIFSEAWADAATRRQIETPHGEMKHGYGYQIWMSDDEGGYQFNGAFGQYVVMIPKYDAVVAVFSGSANLFAQGTLTEHISACFEGASPEPLPEDAAAHAALMHTCKSLRFTPTLKEPLGTDEAQFRAIAALLHGREYRLCANTGGVFPLTIQAVHGNYTMGTDMVRFEKTDYGLDILFYEYAECNRIALNADGSLRYGRIAMRGEWQKIGARAVWERTEEHIKLTVIASLIETPDTRVFRFTLADGVLSLTFDELPELGRVTQMLFQLVGAPDIGYLKRLLTAAQRENLGSTLRDFTAPTAAGTLIRHNA